MSRTRESTRGVREVRILAAWKNQLLRLCKILFSGSDASIYLIPYAPTGHYFSGGAFLAEAEVSGSFDFASGVPSTREPKLSLHQSGQVHLLAGDRRVGPLQTLPLAEYRGEHVATVTFDRFEGLSRFTRVPAASGREIDLTVPVDDDAESGRLALYLNGMEPVFHGEVPCWCKVTMRRATLATPLHLCVKAIGQPALGDPARGGVTVVAGWNPRLEGLPKQDYLYVRGQ